MVMVVVAGFKIPIVGIFLKLVGKLNLKCFEQSRFNRCATAGLNRMKISFKISLMIVGVNFPIKSYLT